MSNEINYTTVVLEPVVIKTKVKVEDYNNVSQHEIPSEKDK